jgi:hypothetical protein
VSIANGKVEIGDIIRIRWPERLKKTDDDIRYIVMGLPYRLNNADTWWTLIGQQTGTLRIVSELMVFEVLS